VERVSLLSDPIIPSFNLDEWEPGEGDITKPSWGRQEEKEKPVETPPKKLVEKATCTSCGTHNCIVLFDSVECFNPNCMFFKKR
jgi:hypothetical protein